MLLDNAAQFARDYAALLISICALFLTISQSRATRRHNRLTVRPHLTSFTEQTADATRRDLVAVKASLTNNGLGPAFIESFQILVDGIPVDVEHPSDVNALVEKDFPLDVIADENWYSVLRKGYVLAKDEKVVLAALTVVRTLDVTEEVLRAALDRYHILVRYKSAYGESFVYDSRDHRQP